MSIPRPASKIWLETDEGYVFGPGVYSLLKAIKDKGTLKEASQSLDMSYRYAWGLIKKAEEKLGAPLIEASKGGRRGGGSSHITELGAHFIDDFDIIQKAWLDFRDHYSNSTVVSANIVYAEGELILRITENIYLPNDSQYSEGEHVKIRVLLE
jgi:molybdate transport repressor ModE-like protein